MEQTATGQIDNIIDDIIKQNKLRRFASELGGVKDNHERSTEIKQIIAVLQGTSNYNFETSAKSIG
jgi:hypothetical protein